MRAFVIRSVPWLRRVRCRAASGDASTWSSHAPGSVNRSVTVCPVCAVYAPAYPDRCIMRARARVNRVVVLPVWRGQTTTADGWA